MAQASAVKLKQTEPAKKEKGVALVPQSEQLVRIPESPLPRGSGAEPSIQITRS